MLFALMPESPNYWANVLPALALETAFVDILYTTSNVFITTHLPRRHQGLAGALINCTLYLGMCFFLGIADVAVAANAHRGLGPSYKVAFWIVAAVSGIIMVMFAFMNVASAKSELTADEKRLRKELETPANSSAENFQDPAKSESPELSTGPSSTVTLAGVTEQGEKGVFSTAASSTATLTPGSS
jgi:MFS family permease